MTNEQQLRDRAGDKCELCGTEEGLVIYEVTPAPDNTMNQAVLICGDCHAQIEDAEKVNIHHWHCLNESMWSEVPAVKVLAWRMLDRLKGEGWPQDLLDMLYLEEDLLIWARMGEFQEDASDDVKHLDSNGTELKAGDTVTLIKDLPVKGAGFTAKRGTAVRGISLVADNSEHIEGRVNGQQIVILTKFVKKSG